MKILSSDFAYLMGNFMADGSFYSDGRNYRFEFVDGSPYKFELEYSLQHILRIKNILESFLKKSLPEIKAVGNKYRLIFRDKYLASIFLETFRLNAGDKSRIIDIPEIYRGSKYELKFWQGYLDGDGSIARKSNRIAVESMSEKIVSSFERYLTKHKIFFSRYKSKRGKEYSQVILIRSISFKDFVTKIGFLHPLKSKLIQEKVVNPEFYQRNSISKKFISGQLIEYPQIFDHTIFLVNGGRLLTKYGYKKYHRSNAQLYEAVSLLKKKGLSNKKILTIIHQYRFKKSKGSTVSVKLPLSITEDILKIAKFVRIRKGGIAFSKAYIISFGENPKKIISLTKRIFGLKPKFTCKNEPIFCSGVLSDFFSYFLKNKPYKHLQTDSFMAIEDIGLRIGIEIHQQLDSGRKLFCHCPAILRADKPDVIVKRRLYAVAGEEGKIDAAAAYEESKKRTYFYEGYSDTNCLLEFDESPPYLIDEGAIKIGLHIALLLNAEPVSVAQVMRKTVVDGSNTSGFQRTVLIAKNGFVEVDGKKIGIPGIYLEEDAARRTSETKDSVTFRLDRLGIPLVEISTAPEISDGEEAKKVALKLGDVLRACRVKRGIGTIRQDVNVSIKKGARTEIKGVQEPDLIPKVIESEIERQQLIVKEKKKVDETVRNALIDGNTKYLRPLPGKSRMYPETDIPFVKISNELIKEARNTLPKLRGEVLGELTSKGIAEEYASLIVKENMLDEFNELARTKTDLNLIAKMLVLYPKEIASHEKLDSGRIEDLLSLEAMKEVLEAVKSKIVAESAVKQVLTEIAKGKAISEVLKGSEVVSNKEIECAVKDILQEKPGLSMGAYMGLLMAKFKGKADGKELMNLLKKHMKL